MAEVWERGMEGLIERRCKGVNNSLYIYIFVGVYVCERVFVSMPTESDQTPLPLLCAAVPH